MFNVYNCLILHRALVVLFCSAVSVCVLAETSSQTNVDFTWGVKIPVADGTLLNGTLYRPANSDGQRLPTIVTITPYISDRYHPDAQYFARNGFVFLAVDTRGRGNSGGKYKPLDVEDGTDGRDIVQWIATQSWSNGKVGMRGGSYGGYNQWATARYFPENLTTIVPIAAPYHGVDFPTAHNMHSPYTIRWLTLTSGVTPQNNVFGDEAFWRQKILEYHTSGIAFKNLDKLVGNLSPTFQQWTNRPFGSWEDQVPSPEQLAKLNLPILTITGYYDGDQPGAMQYYREHMRYGSERSKKKHYLIFGPWDHSGTRMPHQEFGGYKFGDKMMFDALELDKDWYRWTMGDGKRPDFIKDRITYFVAGNNEWKSARSLEAISDRELILYLGADRAHHDVYRSGVLGSPPDTQRQVSEYVYDPLDTRKAERGDAENYITDQIEVTHTDGDGLIFHSTPFTQATEITGFIRLDTWLEMDVPDTDIVAVLYEIRADGSSVALTSGAVRVRYRDGNQEHFMTPGKVEHVVFDDFTFFSRLAAKGSRLRLFLRPANGLNDQRNYNAKKPVIEQTKADAQTATVRLHHSDQYPSRLLLPVVSR